MDSSEFPVIAMHKTDNVAIVVTAGGLKAGAKVRTHPDASPITLINAVPQGHKVALTDIKAGEPVTRYKVSIGIAKQNIQAGSWVHERLLEMPSARNFLNLPMATAKVPAADALTGYTFEGYRNSDGSDVFRKAVEARQASIDSQDKAAIYQGGAFVKAAPHG